MKDEQLRRFLSHLGRGGSQQYWFTLPERRAVWFDVGAPAAMPSVGRNVYFGVCPTGEARQTGRARAADIVAINAVWADYDLKDFGGNAAHALMAAQSLLDPSVIVNSGGGFHAYWLLREPVLINNDNRSDVQQLLRRWVAAVRSDTAVADLARVLRVPGSYNHKYQPERRVDWVSCDLDLLYTVDDIRAALPPDQAPKNAAKNPVPLISPTLPVDDAAVTQRRVEEVLGVAAGSRAIISASRADSYEDWLRVGMALHDAYSGSGTGLMLWDSWSRQSAKYQDGVCAEKWQSFSASGVTINTLMGMARDDDPAAFEDMTRRVYRDAHLARERQSATMTAQRPAQPAQAAQQAAQPDNAPAELTTSPLPGDGIRLSDLQRKDVGRLLWIVDGLIPEGVTLLAAKPKAKKSWLALNVALAVAMHGRALGKLEVAGGAVLYLDLEGNQRRIKSRVTQILGHAEQWPDNVTVYTQWGNGDAVFEQLDYYHDQTPDLRLVVVDLLAEVRPPFDPKTNAYDYDRQFLRRLNGWGEAHHVGVLVIHHVRKAKGDDVFDEVSGTLGINGAVAALLILARNGEGKIQLNRIGRDMEQDDPLPLEWDHYVSGFVIDDDRPSILISEAGAAILSALGSEPRKPAQIATELKIPVNLVQYHLRRLLQEGVVDKAGYGQYQRISS